MRAFALLAMAWVVGCEQRAAQPTVDSPEAASQRAIENEKVARQVLTQEQEFELAYSKLARIGTPVVASPFRITVTAMTTLEEADLAGRRYRAGKNATFVGLVYAIENTSKEPHIFSASDKMRVLARKGRSFAPPTDMNAAYAVVHRVDSMSAELQPGVERKMSTLFEVPKESLPWLSVAIGKAEIALQAAPSATASPSASAPPR